MCQQGVGGVRGKSKVSMKKRSRVSIAKRSQVSMAGRQSEVEEGDVESGDEEDGAVRELRELMDKSFGG